MHTVDRRQFLSTAAAGAGLALLGGSIEAATTPAAPPDPFQMVPLGKTGLKVSLIGCGTGMHGWKRESNQTRMGKEKFEALLHYAFDKGIRFFDLADLYGTHPYVASAFRNIPRDQYVLSSKIWVGANGLPETERPDADVVVDRFRKELNTDYIDMVLIHCQTSGKWPEEQKKQMDILAGLKSKGVIKAHGVSIHSLPALKLAAECPWVDSVHTRINPFGLFMDAQPAEVVPVIQKIHDAGKGVVGMKIIGQGKLANDDAKKTESVKFVLGLGSVDTMIVGFEKIEEIDDFTKRVREALEARLKAV